MVLCKLLKELKNRASASPGNCSPLFSATYCNENFTPVKLFADQIIHVSIRADCNTISRNRKEICNRNNYSQTVFFCLLKLYRIF